MNKECIAIPLHSTVMYIVFIQLKDSTYYLILFTMYNTISASISLRTHQNVLDRFITHSSVFSYMYVQCYSLFHTYIVLLWSSKIKKPRCFIKRKE